MYDIDKKFESWIRFYPYQKPDPTKQPDPDPQHYSAEKPTVWPNYIRQILSQQLLPST